MEFSFNYKRKNVSLEVYKVPWWYEGIGLTFTRKKKAKILLFDLRRLTSMSIYSWFVFFPFIAVWLDENKKVVDIQKVNPFKLGILPTEKFRYLIEIPLGGRHDAVVQSIVGKKTFK